MAAEPVLPHIEWNNMAAEPIISPQNVPPEPVLPQVDWNSLQITGQYEEDRMEIVSEEQMYVLLGLRDEDERAQKKEEDNEMVRAMRRLYKLMILQVLQFLLVIAFQMKL